MHSTWYAECSIDCSVVYLYAGEGGAEGAVQASVRGHHEAVGQTGERLPSPGLTHTERGMNTFDLTFIACLEA